MATSSRQAGFLAALNAIPADQAIEDALNPTIAGITGFNGNTQVRPRFQIDPPTVPNRETDWVAFGINRIVSQTCAATIQKDQTTAAVVRTQQIEVLLSWYGPNAGNYAEVFRDGLQIDQNRDALRANDFGIIEIGEARKAPELFKEKYLVRYDMTLTLRRRTERLFPIYVFTSAGITLNTDPAGETPITLPITQ